MRSQRAQAGDQALTDGTPARNRTVLRTAATCGLLLTMTFGAAGCAKAGGGQGSEPSPAGDGTSASAQTDADAAGKAQTGGDRCHTGGLKVTIRGIGAAAGNHYSALVFTNTSGSSCRVYGYPGMQLLGKDDDKVATKVVRDAGAKPKLITLKDGDSAWSQASWGAVPGAGEDQKGGCEPDPISTEVTPPDETEHKIVDWAYGPVCQHGRITVTALAAGDGPGH